jgi:Lon protease (S16) C-terminal proteolytic domain
MGSHGKGDKKEEISLYYAVLFLVKVMSPPLHRDERCHHDTSPPHAAWRGWQTFAISVHVRPAGRTIFRVVILVFGLAHCERAVEAGDLHRFATVPALAVSNTDSRVGGIHYIAIQLDEDDSGRGPTIDFSEQLRGSTVGQEWKAGVRAAVAAAGRVMGADTRYWTVTVRNASYNSYTEGASASSAIAVGLIAARRGDTLNQDVAITGAVLPDGRLLEADGLPAKLDGAARGNMRLLLIPRGQARTDEWDLMEQGRQRNVTVIEVGTLHEAYELMVRRPP